MMKRIAEAFWLVVVTPYLLYKTAKTVLWLKICRPTKEQREAKAEEAAETIRRHMKGLRIEK